MACLLCGSTHEKEFAAEMVIHLGGLTNIDNPGVWVFPELVTCLDCGVVRFNVSKTELALLDATPPSQRVRAAAAG
jgi:hypothetical protein